MHGYPVMQVVQYHVPPHSVQPIPPHINPATPGSGGIRKYVFWCCICGGMATILGALFLAVYFLLRSYTSTLGYFETIPTFVPATMLILTGLCVMSLARRKNRYSYLIKVCGLCCLVCALTCVLVTITTTVIHMNRLQALKECVYTQKTRTCTCYSVVIEAHATTDEGVRFVFDSTPDCEVIHGALYSCLRAMFGLSVSGILVCIFSCMLVYQLLSHERKKMYWEQLELRCRSFYQQHSAAPSSTHGSMRGPPMPPATYCSCCEECRYPSIPTGHHIYPWDSHHSTDRFWTPGRVGNFYSPNPGEEATNPATETRERTGWNWRKLPWNRGNSSNQESQRDNSLTYQGGISSADSQYGFSNRSGGDSTLPISSTGSYSVLDNRPVGGVYVWGPPPPYSNPNSPARLPMQSPQRYHHVHHHNHAHENHCQMNEENQFRTNQDFQFRRSRQYPSKDNYENTTEAEGHHQPNDNSESTDTSSCDRVSHTLPVRKMKKRVDMSSVKAQVTNSRTNVKNVFGVQNVQSFPEESKHEEEHKYHEPNLQEGGNSGEAQPRFLPRLQGVENAAFQKQESPQKTEPTESEVYFADVSSCCNISVRNDGQDSSLYDEALDNLKPRLISLQCSHKSPEKEQSFDNNVPNSEDAEDYLAHRLGKRQMSTRSRLPFPLPDTDELTMPEIGESCGLPKDLSQNSLCSSVQTPMTETTDVGLSPLTPTFPNVECCRNYFPGGEKNQDKRKNFQNNDEFLAPDAQYEVIQENSSQQQFRHNYNESSNLTNTISGLNNFGQNYFSGKNNFNQGNFSPKNIPPKSLNLNLNQSPRRNIGTNISTLIQNLGGNPVGLLYSEANSGDEEVQTQACHSDGTMDSGWQSGSEKQDRKPENAETVSHMSVNV
ncbi:uncharacterized protein [Onthophagus taurus]|uniref:uncharacterized protein isoform X2 n=1 Tax=Onthophagus taurus TaxID=166361 RepID=UPI000C202AA5|nr:uncharacterized protein LOC111429588 isoform X2 [Onthophagus taurus]